jgi:hypothetical protein
MKVLAVALLLTAGCATAPAAETGGRCDAARAQKLVGRTRSEKAGAEALRLSGATALRWIAPGTMVTMDYRENRINLRLDPKNKIVVINCG